MGKTPILAPEQLAALGRVAALPQAEALHLVDGSAIAVHFDHRRSEDLDLFSTTPDLDLDALRRKLRTAFPTLRIRGASDVALRVVAEGAAIDFVRYPYPPLEPPVAGPDGFPTAGVRDLGAMKMAAISNRGIRRDFWDLYVIARATRPLTEIARDYVAKFGRSESDLYHVFRSLTYFVDAESDPLYPAGMTPDMWGAIKAFFESEAHTLVH